MRLIDANAFAEFIKNTITEQKYKDLELSEHITVAEVLEQVVSELDGTSLDGFKNAPTIEAEPVRHGSWVGIDDYPHETWECDQCGCIYEEMPSWTPNYCPNCGAKMDGSDE